ncbi:hypothetical protein CO608_05890 [Lysobacteraceae bacterium NML08-0793]|nr:hypothetical protein CO608_05890 [Xanthomonadaceae bacterium NML08-0793]
MEPMNFEDISDEVFIEDIMELTQSLADEFPQWFKTIEQRLAVDSAQIRFTDFVENNDDVDSPIEFAGYFYELSERKMYQYTVESGVFDFAHVDMHTLSVRDTFSIKVLHLLK